MDGLDDTNATKGAISDEQQPSVESLGEESVMINDYSAQFGESGGGVFNYTSKSGTNKLHGSAFNYLENEDLDAGQPFNYVNASYLPEGSTGSTRTQFWRFSGWTGGDSSRLQRPR